jgi:hypothetical protein
LEQPVVPFGPEDAPALLALSESIGWPHELVDWQAALAGSRIFGHKQDDGMILSSSAIYQFQPDFAALALVIVREGYRGRGLAREAVLACLRQVPGTPVMLVATEYGEPLYRKLGFETVQQAVRLVAPSGASFTAEGAVQPMTDSDLPLALELDRVAYGADRGVVLRRRWLNAERGVLLRDSSGLARGFAWITRQRGGLIIGPIIASVPAEAVCLLAALSAGVRDRMKIEVPDTQVEFIRLLQAAGFAIDSSRAFMVKDCDALPGHWEMRFALASLGYG